MVVFGSKELTNADWKKASQAYQNSWMERNVYTLQEEKVAEYTTTIDQVAYTITNTHAPGKTSVTVTKKWDDENDKDGIRPKSIRVQLYANDQKVGQEARIVSWKQVDPYLADLDEKANGNTINLQWEKSVFQRAMKLVMTEDRKGNVVITNKHVPKRNPKQPTPPSSSEPKKSIILKLKPSQTRAEETRQDLDFTKYRYDYLYY